MIKKFLHKILPHPKDVHKHGYLRIFGKFILDPRLWQMNVASVALAVAVALFSGFIPFPAQAIIAILIALIVRANIPVTGIVVWYSNPFTMPALFYFAYKIGAMILSTPPRTVEIQLNWQWLTTELGLIAKPLLLGCFICGVVAGLAGYILVWGLHGILRWYRITRAKRHHHKIKNFIRFHAK